MLPVVLAIIRIAVQIFAMTFVIYRLYSALAETKAVMMIYAIFTYAAIVLLCEFLQLDVLGYILRMLFIPYVLVFLIIYSNEIKHAVMQFTSSTGLIRRRGNLLSADAQDQIINACYTLAGQKRGALIVICRSDKLSSLMEKSPCTLLDAKITSALLLTIFDHDTPLHDGAVIIDYDKIVAAGCFLPLSEQTDIKSTLGTRHRAALGLSEESDAIVLVVSEETQTISVCFNSMIHTELEMTDLKKLLIQYMTYQEDRSEE